jgi:bifunctional non-homologous end joining protein LigD
MDVIEVHPWGATVDNIEEPDLLVFDLDPGEGVEWQFVLDTALRLRDMLADVKLDSLPKTTGGTGLHVVVSPIPEMHWHTARDYAHTIAEHFAASDPRRYTSSSSRAGRSGKVFIDYLRNGRGNTRRYATDPVYREQLLKRLRKRYATDPEYREQLLKRLRKRYAHNRERQREI